jgi:hypothetical protein
VVHKHAFLFQLNSFKMKKRTRIVSKFQQQLSFTALPFSPPFLLLSQPLPLPRSHS